MILILTLVDDITTIPYYHLLEFQLYMISACNFSAVDSNFDVLSINGMPVYYFKGHTLMQ